MTSQIQVQLLVSLGGGAYIHGAQTAAFGQTVAMQLVSTSGLTSLRYEIYDYPPSWTAPAGWSTDASGVIFYAPSNVTIPPPAFTLPLSGAANFGWWMMRARGNTNPLRLNADGSPNVNYNSLLTDEGTAIDILGPVSGQPGVGFGLSNQVDSLRQWARPLMDSLRALEVISAGVGPLARVGAAQGPTYTALAGQSGTLFLIDTTGGTLVTFKLPAVIVDNQRFRLVDATAQFAAHALTLDGNGHNIVNPLGIGNSGATAATLTLNQIRTDIEVVGDATQGVWLVI